MGGAHAVPDDDSADGRAYALAIVQDITDRKRAEAALEQERVFFDRLFEGNPEGVALVDPDDRVLRINSAFQDLFGYSREEAVGRTIAELIVPDGHKAEALSITEAVRDGESVQHDTVRLHRDGNPIDVCVVGAPIRLRGIGIGAYGIYLDIRARKNLELELRRMSTTDELTGLLNRRGFMQEAERQWSRARRNGEDLLLLYIDLDDFKEINDRHGHAVGDRVLQEFSEVLRRTYRATDTIARLGGDEFVVLTVNGSGDAASYRGQLDEAVQRWNESREQPFSLRLSAGVDRAPASRIGSLDELLTQADRRMYEKKRQSGREGGS